MGRSRPRHAHAGRDKGEAGSAPGGHPHLAGCWSSTASRALRGYRRHPPQASRLAANRASALGTCEKQSMPAELSNLKNECCATVDRLAAQLIDISHRIHAAPELAFNEH